MSKLRILEEGRRKLKSFGEEKKIEIFESIRDIIIHDEKVVIAVIHGGFTYSNKFRDIDILIYLDNSTDELKHIDEYIDELRDNIEKKLKIGVDIQILNYAPPKFIIKALKKGIILFERKPGISSILKIHALEEERKIKNIRNMLANFYKTTKNNI